jgi:two-component system, chemotaxis family, protein-glutamate methylesterase/glutaminase
MALTSVSPFSAPVMAMNDARVKRDVIVIGASAGGVRALLDLCAELPPDLPAAVGVVIHRSPWYRLDAGSIYGHRAKIRVREGRSGEELQWGTVYFAPADRHMLFEPSGIAISRGAKVHFSRPAVDVLFESAAVSFKERVTGVLLTGNGSDGGHGLVMIKRHHGVSLVQKPEEASHPSMPLTGLREDTPGTVTLEELPAVLWALARGERIVADAPEPMAT